MVAEFVARQNGSPINGETVCLNLNIPSGHSMAHAGHVNGGGGGGVNGVQHNLHHNQIQQLNHQSHQAQQHNNVHNNLPTSSANTPQHNSSSLSDTESQGHPDNYGPNFDLRKELFSQRKQREFIPDNKKDDSYWDRRRRNNEAAKRSREKRRFNDMVLEQRVMELSKENHILKAQLEAIHERYGICGESEISAEHVLAALPNEPPPNLVKRPKLTPTNAILYARSPSPVPTSVIIHQTVVNGGAGGGAAGGGGARSPRSPAQLHVNNEATNNSYNDTECFQYNYNHHSGIHFDTTSALNLSRGGRRTQSPFELSSGSGDEGGGGGVGIGIGGPQVTASSQTTVNNSLPHKLRHKSRIGDKDAASALLALQGIKQEPGPRASPPWDNEGSSDERDSGISLGTEWANNNNGIINNVPESEHEVKSRLDRLASEVASLQSILRLSKPGESNVQQQQGGSNATQ